jgi:hypothetical protein
MSEIDVQLQAQLNALQAQLNSTKPSTPPRPSLVWPSIILGLCMIASVWVYSSRGGGGVTPGPDDDVKPADVDVALIEETFQQATREFIAGLGKDREELGQKVLTGEVKKITEVIDQARQSYTARQDAYIAATGKISNEYLNLEVSKDGEPVGTDEITDDNNNRKRTGSFLSSSGKGIQQSVSK